MIAVVVKWADVKRAGVPRRAWRRVKQRIRPVAGAEKLWRAADVANALGVDPGVFDRAQTMVR